MNQGEVLMSDTPRGGTGRPPGAGDLHTGQGHPPRSRINAPTMRGADAAPTYFRCERINTFYGKSHILHDATLDVRDGEIVALLGRNGRRQIHTPEDAGRPRAGGLGVDRISGPATIAKTCPRPTIARMGIGYVPQGRGLFAGLTVRGETLRSAGLARARRMGQMGVVWDEAQILDHFPAPEGGGWTSRPIIFSGGEQQMVAVARALSGNVKASIAGRNRSRGLAAGRHPGAVRRVRSAAPPTSGSSSSSTILDLVLAPRRPRVSRWSEGRCFHQGPAQPLLTDLDYRKKNPVALNLGEVSMRRLATVLGVMVLMAGHAQAAEKLHHHRRLHQEHHQPGLRRLSSPPPTRSARAMARKSGHFVPKTA